MPASPRVRAAQGLSPPTSVLQPNPTAAPASDEPAAKRPATRESIQMVQTGFRPMTLLELTAGFHQLNSQVHREEDFTVNIHGAVDTNALLLVEAMARIQRIEG